MPTDASSASTSDIFNAATRSIFKPTLRAKWKQRLSNLDVKRLAFACSASINEGPPCSVAFHRNGASNIVLLVTFPNGLELIVRIPIFDSPEALKSTVATMSYARHVLGVYCPSVFAWNDSHENSVGLPYIIMEKVQGEPLDTLWDKMDLSKRLFTQYSVAKVHSRLFQKPHFQTFGSLFFSEEYPDLPLDDTLCYTVGPLVKNKHIDEDGKPYLEWSAPPFDSIRDFWRRSYTLQYNAMRERLFSGSEEAQLRDGDEDEELEDCGISTWRDAERVAENLKALIDNTEIPPCLEQPCLVHADLAFRNILFRYNARKPDESAVAFLDWDEAAILPSVLGAHYPDEFKESEPYEPRPEERPVLASLAGDWSTFADKPDSWYNDSDSVAHVKALHQQLYKYGVSKNNMERSAGRQVYLQMLRLWGVDSRHFLNLEDIPSGSYYVRLASDSQVCNDAREIHFFMRYGYLYWFSKKDSLAQKADKIRTEYVSSMRMQRILIRDLTGEQ